MIETAERALAAGIAAARPGNRIGDISAAIGHVINDAGFAVNTSFGGHGVGRTMHEAPHVPNEGEAGKGPQLRPGLVIAIEPWFLAGNGRDPDGQGRLDDPQRRPLARRRTSSTPSRSRRTGPSS